MRDGVARKPDVRHGGSQFDMTHALAADALGRHFDAATLADLAAGPDALILSAGAFPVLRRPENTLAEQTVALGFERAVVDGLGLGDLAVRPGANHLGRREADSDGLKYFFTHINQGVAPFFGGHTVPLFLF